MSNFDALAFIKKLHGPPGAFDFDAQNQVATRSQEAPYKTVDVTLPLANIVATTQDTYKQATHLEKLSFLLLSSYGIQKTRVHFYQPNSEQSNLKLAVSPRRVIASGGASYPTNIYITLQSNKKCAYLFHYLPTFHALSMASETSLNHKTTFYFCIQFNKTTPKYKSFAYRLTAVDNGLVIARTLLILNSLAIPAQLALEFDQRQYETILRLDNNQESLYAMIHVDTLFCAELPESKFNENQPHWKTTLPYELSMMDQLCRITSHIPRKESLRFHNEEAIFSLDYLTQAISNRSSRANYFTGLSASKRILLDSLATTAKSLKFMRSSCASENLPTVKMYCLVLNIDEIEPGAYFYDQTSQTLQFVQSGHYHKFITDCLYLKSANIGLASYIVHFISNLEDTLYQENMTVYRIQQMLIGCGIEALTLSVSNHGLSAHPYLGFNAQQLQTVYAEHLGAHELPLGQVCVGVAKNDGRIEIPIVM